MIWMIEINELEDAENMKKEIENKFFGEKLKVFKTAFNLLKIKKEESEEKLKNKIKNNKISEKNEVNDMIKKENENNENNSNTEKNIIYRLINKYKYLTLSIGGIFGGLVILLLYKYRHK